MMFLTAVSLFFVIQFDRTAALARDVFGEKFSRKDNDENPLSSFVFINPVPARIDRFSECGGVIIAPKLVLTTGYCVGWCSYYVILIIVY